MRGRYGRAVACHELALPSRRRPRLRIVCPLLKFDKNRKCCFGRNEVHLYHEHVGYQYSTVTREGDRPVGVAVG